MTIYGTPYFVNFTKACDYYRDQGNDELTPNELGKLVQEKIDDDEIYLGKPDIQVGETLRLIDGGTRYALETD